MKMKVVFYLIICALFLSCKTEKEVPQETDDAMFLLQSKNFHGSKYFSDHRFEISYDHIFVDSSGNEIRFSGGYGLQYKDIDKTLIKGFSQGLLSHKYRVQLELDADSDNKEYLRANLFLAKACSSQSGIDALFEIEKSGNEAHVLKSENWKKAVLHENKNINGLNFKDIYCGKGMLNSKEPGDTPQAYEICIQKGLGIVAFSYKEDNYALKEIVHND